ncbi:MAG TPA: hypothetical protein VES93_16895 [Ornithinibacter sp.]|nr:hypothetical protein [Ornithinibacter sp.]
MEGQAELTTTTEEIIVFQRLHSPSVATLVTRRAAALVLAACATLAVGAGPAAARPEAGPALTGAGQPGQDTRSAPVDATSDGHGCALRRVDTQYVRCDDNSGNGVPAPAWIPER